MLFFKLTYNKTESECLISSSVNESCLKKAPQQSSAARDDASQKGRNDQKHTYRIFET